MYNSEAMCLPLRVTPGSFLNQVIMFELVVGTLVTILLPEIAARDILRHTAQVCVACVIQQGSLLVVMLFALKRLSSAYVGCPVAVA